MTRADIAQGRGFPGSAADSFESALKRSNLTRRQLLIYTGQQLFPGILLYDAVWAIRLTDLDVPAFETAFAALVQSYDALRTVVEEIEGVPRQSVRSELPVALVHVDLRDRARPDAAAEEWMYERCRAPFDLAERVFDTALLRTGDAAHVWYLNVHHIVADGWAVDLLVQSLLRLYAQARRGERLAPPEAPSFHDYARRERQRAHLPKHRQAETYWRGRLSAPREMPRLFGHRSQTSATLKRRVVIDLGEEATRCFNALVNRADVFNKSVGATSTNVLAALLFAFAYRCSRLRDLGLGVAFHNRTTDEQKRLVGLVMEALPFLVTVDPEQPFLALIQSVHAMAGEALQHRAHSVGNPVHAPLYDMFLNMVRTIEMGEGQGQARRIFPGHGETTLSLTAVDAGASDNLQLWLDVRADLLDEIGDEAFARRFETLVKAAIAHPEMAIAELPLIAEAERRRVVVDWNATGTVYPDDCIHHMVERQVERTPDATAVVYDEERLTYSELDARADRLARHLRGLGVKPETLVGICLKRSVEMVVALLGVLKAGGTYAPLDPAYPTARLQHVVEDAGVRLVLTQEDLRLQSICPAARWVCVDALASTVADRAGRCPHADITSDNAAYVLYTSGSTGRPKGVVIRHASVANYLHWRRDYFPLTASDAVLQTASISFDDSVWQIFEPLSVGARLVLVEAGREHDIAHQVRLIQRHQVSAACFVPSLMGAFLSDADSHRCHSLRRVTTGGEVLPFELQERFFAALPAARLYNGYGPTEATVSATFWECRRGSARRPVPIGRPIANVRVYILDQDGQPAPIGVAGQIHIGGAGVARGYHNQGELTAERFIADPFSDAPGARLYRTGDIGRWLPDGNIEFLGRLDDQVKLRGFRIELGEIEARLREHPAVREAAVALCADGDRQYLAAYFTTPTDAEAPTADALRRHLASTMPPHMMPSSYIHLTDMPLSVNGKIHRKALPTPRLGPSAICETAAPLGDVEISLAKIWADLLGHERIGRQDSFFELGGHSLLAVRMISAVKRGLGIDLIVPDVYQSATLALLAKVIEERRSANSLRPVVVEMRAGHVEPPIYFIHAGPTEFGLAQKVGTGQAVFGVAPAMPSSWREAAANLDATALPTMAALAEPFAAAVRSHVGSSRVALAGYSFGGMIAFDVARQLREQGLDVQDVILFDTWAAPAKELAWSNLWPDLSIAFKALVAARPAGSFAVKVHIVWTLIEGALHAELRRIVRKKKLRSSRAVDTSNLTHIRDEDGTPLGWPLLSTIYTHARRTCGLSPLNCRGILFRAAPERDVHHVAHARDDSLGWRRLFSNGLRIVPVPGGHIDMVRDRAHADTLSQQIAWALTSSISR